MAGNEENTDFLASFNQSIKAINDLATAVAALVLQVTNNVTCTPEVNLTCAPNIVVQTQPGAPGGTTLPTEPGTEGGEPPTGYEEIPGGAPADRKCRAANMISDYVEGVIGQLSVNDVDTYATLGFTITCTLIGAALGSVVPALGTAVGAVAGALAGMAVFLIQNGSLISLEDMGTVWSENQVEIIQALYDSTTVGGARSAIDTILDNGGSTAGERGLFALLLTDEVLNYLYFSTSDLEPTIAEYPVSVECEGGSETPLFQLGNDSKGTYVSGGWELGQSVVLQSQKYEGAGLHLVRIWNISGVCSNVEVTATSEGYVPRNQTTGPIEWSDCEGVLDDTPLGQNPVGLNFDVYEVTEGYNWLIIWSESDSVQFTVTFTFNGPA